MLVNSLTSLTTPLHPWTFWIGLTASQSWFFVLDRIVLFIPNLKSIGICLAVLAECWEYKDEP